jgi:peptidoglycan-associated lipoprotein
MSPHPSRHTMNRRVSQYVLSQLDRHLIPMLLVIGVAGACSHTQPEMPAPAHPTVAMQQPPRRPPPPAPAPEPAAVPVDSGKSKELAVYFDFDSSLLRDDARPVLQKVATIAKNRNSVRIEGNCDEVGTIEYNLALGEHRAIQAKDYLTRLGIPSGHIKTVSYGSQHPKSPGHDDEAHAENRRDDFILR